MRILVRFGIPILALALTACTSSGRYSQHYDSAPAKPPAQLNQQDAIPVHIPFSPRGNQPYRVLGKSYTPLSVNEAIDYEVEGEASWYGQKFHGHMTSNGEIYDMYAMSAAHKTLPIPSFVRVTNLSNNKQVVVRVNDRGPFHGNRVLDLSYAAAAKLGMLKTGTAHVRIEKIHVKADGQMLIAGQPVNPASEQDTQAEKALYIQVAALSDGEKARQLGRGLENLYQLPMLIAADKGIHRLRLGPIDDEQQAELLLLELRKNGYEQAYSLYAPASESL
ncbi:RlpA-like lipoprotein [Saliniradius amylolyticus]|uniref:Endolytic peptidoglycan transglycosylase RlpA n=1 Tax=Saliniradius amylolyticus TaxID=2183582 RepID=A0A2S2E1E4_9ALTE|nr:septal ring lytic transglycosylase RlpA family protein [Saliniradius amylolyticus]AWL11446.1 RlpA-like lipoprotein [Saliniradius amylolyticus]